jgi:hypothetical protein
MAVVVMAAIVLYGQSLERSVSIFRLSVKTLSGDGGIKRLDTIEGRAVNIWEDIAKLCSALSYSSKNRG